MTDGDEVMGVCCVNDGFLESEGRFGEGNGKVERVSQLVEELDVFGAALGYLLSDKRFGFRCMLEVGP